MIPKTIYLSTRKYGILKANTIKKRLINKGWILMWVGEGLMCLMK